MKNAASSVLLTASLLACPGARAADAPETILFEARIVATQFRDDLRRPDPPPNVIELGGPVEVSVRTGDFLIGTARQVSSVTLEMTDTPNLKLLNRIVVLASVSADGRLHVEGWSYAKDDFCVTADAATRLHIESRLAQLYDTGRLRCSR